MNTLVMLHLAQKAAAACSRTGSLLQRFEQLSLSFNPDQILEREHPEYAMSEQRAAHDDSLCGLLQQAPNWLDLLIKTLPRGDKLAIFQTCRQLARQVMQTSPCVTLCFMSEAPAQPLETRSQIITQLLDVGRSFAVMIRAPGPQPFPSTLSDRVYGLWLRATEGGATDSFQWGQLQNLAAITWAESATDQDISGLCEAVEQGHVQKLDRMTITATMSDTSCARLASALGPQLVYLQISNAMLINHLPRFQQLRNVCLHIHGVPNNLVPGVLTALCKLPKLLKFGFVDDDVVVGGEGNMGQQSAPGKRWIVGEVGPYMRDEAMRSLKISRPYKHLASLPYTVLDKVEFCGVLSHPFSRGSRALGEVLGEHGDKVVCTPDCKGAFELQALTPELRQLTNYLQGAHTFIVGLHIPLESLPTLWPVVPLCVEQIQFRTLSGPGWLCIWDGLPRSVVKVELFLCSIPADELPEVVGSVPEHVKELKVVRPFDDSTMLAFDFKQHAPAHVKLEVEGGRSVIDELMESWMPKEFWPAESSASA